MVIYLVAERIGLRFFIKKLFRLKFFDVRCGCFAALAYVKTLPLVVKITGATVIFILAPLGSSPIRTKKDTLAGVFF